MRRRRRGTKLNRERRAFMPHRIQDSHRTLRAVPPLPDSPTADVFAADDTVFVRVTGPETARVLHIDVRLDGAQTNDAGKVTHPRACGGKDSAFPVHPDATPC
jgi:hypothetical protein